MKNTTYCDSENKINDDSKLERDTASIANTIPKPKPKPKLKPRLKPKQSLNPNQSSNRNQAKAHNKPRTTARQKLYSGVKFRSDAREKTAETLHGCKEKAAKPRKTHLRNRISGYKPKMLKYFYRHFPINAE